VIKAESGKKAKSRARVPLKRDKGKRIKDETSYLKMRIKG
jgi:hypothetical protein